MKTVLARYLSIVGHPFVLMTLLVFVPRWQSAPDRALRTTAAFVAIAIVPIAVLVWRSRATGRWTTVDASNKADRPRLYAVAAGVLLALAAYFQFVEHAPGFVRGCAVAGGMIACAAVLNRWIKLSLHVAFASLCAVVLAKLRLAFGLPVLLLIPPLMWSRVALDRHTLSETIGGLALGLAGAAGLIWF